LRLDASRARGEWELRFAWPEEGSAHEEVLRLVAEGALRPRRYITHVVPLEQAPEGFELIRKREALKVVVRMD